MKYIVLELVPVEPTTIWYPSTVSALPAFMTFLTVTLFVEPSIAVKVRVHPAVVLSDLLTAEKEASDASETRSQAVHVLLPVHFLM